MVVTLNADNYELIINETPVALEISGYPNSVINIIDNPNSEVIAISGGLRGPKGADGADGAGGTGNIISVNGDEGPEVVLTPVDIGALDDSYIPSWSSISNKPSTYPPNEHSHAIGQVEGLQSALNNKAPLDSPTFTGTVSGVLKSHVGLSNVDNTSDSNKPVSSAQQTALNLKANLASPTFTGTVSGITKAMVGLSNVDNTTDANKPVSTATQTALNSKAATSHTHVAANITDLTATVQGIVNTQLDIAGAPGTLDTINELAAALGDDANYAATVTNALALKAPLDSPAFTGTPTGITKAHIGLGNVDNTTDAGKPISTATQTALNAKANIASPTFTGTVSGISKTMVGLGNVDNTSDTNKPVSTATQAALNDKAAAVHSHSADQITSGTISPARLGTGTANSTTFLAGDNTWKTVSSSTNIAGLPSGTTLVVQKDSTTGNWPGGTSSTGVRPTARTDIVVIWKGADPSPSIVSSGTGGMMDNVDIRIVT